jgi:hypothetical protein
MTVVVGVTSWIMPTVFAMLVSCEVVVGGYLLVIGIRAFLRADGTGEGLVALIAMLSGTALMIVGVGAAMLWRRGAPHSRRLKIAAFAVAALPLAPLWWWMQPDPWTFPKRPEVVCFSPEKRDQIGEVGWSVDGKRSVVDRLFPSRPKDFVYLVQDSRGHEQRLEMDCSNQQRCRFRDGTDDDLRGLLAHLKGCD